MPTIKLKSSDDVVITVDMDTARYSNTIKTMLDDLGTEDGDDEVVPLPNVTSEILNMVLEWAEHHKNDMPQDQNNQEISEWDQKFLNVDKLVLFELTRAANYLDVKGLLDTTCKAVAKLIAGRTPKQIREVFDLATT